MRAVLCRELGPPERLIVEEVPAPHPGPGEVAIEVHACGVNFPDTLIIQGKYQFRPDLPFSPGSEVAGIVRETGEGVEDLRGGDRVLAVTGWGGFAEEVAVPRTRVLPLPDGMDLRTGAAFAMAYGTSYHALVQRGRLQPGETLLVLGAAGGVGLAAVELGRALGARVIAAGRDPDRLERTRAFGADAIVTYAEANWKDRVKDLTDGRGADVIYDAVGGAVFDEALRCIAWRGRILVVGFASGTIPAIPANRILLKGCEVVGVFWGAFREREPERNADNFRALFQLHAEGRIRPQVSATFPLEDATGALEALLARRVLGKIILTVDRGDPTARSGA